MHRAPVQENNSTAENNLLNYQQHTIRNVQFTTEGTRILSSLHIYASCSINLYVWGVPGK
jgi:hypothetical protein